MDPIDLFQNPLRRWNKANGGKVRPRVPVKQLHPRDRRRMRRHFLDLDAGDRLLRFGSALSDEQIERYVGAIDFSRDIVFGVYNRVFRLVAVGHLAFAARDASKAAVTDKARVAEFGVSVSRSARGIGIGAKLFGRAAIHCRNNDVDTLYMHCLSSNQTMMHIARKAGMEIRRAYGEADAYLKLPPADPASVMQEALDEQFATLDYTFKANKKAARKWLARLTWRMPKKK
ncbi:histone acetyltransferase [Duganella sp. Leaf126]|uniref:GNAT family N-acetyltransferase n=1 Tax=Duganella sp. Leaf126 TaxID=1736266 RepID=UPI0006FDA7A8|nr:GNAT family N-acetyltransferase [Duganella sp. Leaf126]KQQ32607.1 histone acetyltransferase [Duganella sp. Leaf126]